MSVIILTHTQYYCGGKYATAWKKYHIKMLNMS